MFSQFAVAAVVFGSIFSMSSIAAELSIADDKKRSSSKLSHRSLEVLVDIHQSPAVLAHPTIIPTGEASIAELNRLRVEGEAREQTLRTWYQARGLAFPERFAGD